MDSDSSYLTIGEWLWAAVIPLIAVVEAVVFAFAGCFDSHHRRRPLPRLQFSFADLVRISHGSLFAVNEVEALLVLFKRVSCSIIDDGLIHEEELQLALLQTQTDENLFLAMVFDLFDENKNGVIEFEEFIHALNVFHSRAPIGDKIDYAFRLYDLRQTGYIEREEVQQMLTATLLESDIKLSEENLEDIISKTFADAEADKDGKIKQTRMEGVCHSESSVLEEHDSSLFRGYITAVFPSFIFNIEVDD